MPSTIAISIADQARYSLQLGSGHRNSSRLAFGLFEYIGIRIEAERLRADSARFTGASNPGTRRRYELVVGAANASSAGACLRRPPAAQRPRSLRPAYPSPANSGLPLFHNDVCVCMPLPLSSKIGLGMKVTVFPLRRATFLQMYLNHIIWSAICTSSANNIPISLCPAVPTSWWC